MDAAYFMMKAAQWISNWSGRIYAKSVPYSAHILFGGQEGIDVKCILQLASDQTKIGAKGKQNDHNLWLARSN